MIYVCIILLYQPNTIQIHIQLLFHSHFRYYNQMTEPNSSNRTKIDLIVIGNPNSGKTSLIRRFIEGQTSFQHFYTPTLGLTLQKKVIQIDNSQVTVCIWDTAGQQKFFSLTKNYFKKADGVLVVFDLTDKNSFDRVDKFWMQQIKQKYQQNCSQILIGNKKDMITERAVSQQSARGLAEGLGIKYFETSAKTGESVEQSIQYLVKECLQKVKVCQDSVHLKISPVNRNGGCLGTFKDFFGGIREKFK